MPTRILHVANTLNTQPGSVAILLRGLFDALSERGIESQVVTAPGGPVSDVRVPVHAFDPDRAAALVRDHDVIHLHGWGTDPAFVAIAALARKLGKPYVIAPHGSLTSGPHTRPTFKDKLRWLVREKQLVREASAIIALNDFEANDLRDRGGYANAMVLPYGIDFASYAERNDDASLPAVPEVRCLLMLGPLDPIEGLVPLLKAFAETGADAEGWYVALVGEQRGEWKNSLAAAIRRKQATDRVVFADAADVATQRAWLARASLVVSPSLHIRVPVSIMQAVACGKALLASDRAAPPIVDEVATVVAPARDQLRAALSRLLTTTPEELSAAGEKAREAAAEYDWPTWAQRFEDLYSGLA